MFFCLKNKKLKTQPIVFQLINQIPHPTEHHWHHDLKT